MSLDLFNLLPAVYRIRDLEMSQSGEPGPLESLMRIIEEQLAILDDDIDQLYDNQFIETCVDWVIPYIGDLIGYQSVKGIAPAIDNPRSEVANTISLRRRKGTVVVMEQLALDATAWGAHAVEFFNLLGTTQYMNHLRRSNHYAPDLRSWKPGLYVDTGFDRTAHKLDVRRIAARRGRYNIQNVGIFLWSLNAYSVTKDQPAPSPSHPQCLRFSSLGMDIPLFHRAIGQGEQINEPAQPFNVVGPLKRPVLCNDLLKGVGAVYYGEGKSLVIYFDNQPLSPFEIRVANLSGADGSWVNLPTGKDDYRAVIDPELGRIALPPAASGAKKPPKVTVSYYYGFNADIGGGEYDRADSSLVNPLVLQFSESSVPPATLQDALDSAVGKLSGGVTKSVAVEIASTCTYPSSTPLSVDVPAGCTLELRAKNRVRPTLLLNGQMTVSGGALSSFALTGLLIAESQGAAPSSSSDALVHIPSKRKDGTANELQTLDISHCTLLPGWSVQTDGTPNFGAQPALVAEPGGLQITVQKSIVGAIRAGEFVTVKAFDSIIDATDPTNVAIADLDGQAGVGSLMLGGLETSDPDEIQHGCTVIGKVHTVLLRLVSDTIIWADLGLADSWSTGLIADRKQEGCVRFSFLPKGAKTPRRFECIERVVAGPQPIFFAFRYGSPGYVKLLSSTPDVVRRGADDSGEMGAFHFLLAPLRETDLRVRMQEYMPVGLEFGIFYQS